MQVIAHNMLSQFTNRQLKISTNEKKKSTEKLSSGYKINRSADDAAGLQISEKLRWQIRGLNQGKDNIQDGISLIKTGEGALAEVHDILQRVRELSVQAYNDTNTEQDRQAIQSEVDEVLEEIDRISDTTTFNTKYLLKGNPVETIQVSEDMEVNYTVQKEITFTLPEWLREKVDDEMKEHSYNQAPGDYDGIMRQTVTNSAGKEEVVYYGPEHDPFHTNTANMTWTGVDWDNSINNNPTAKVDFSGLENHSNSAEDLYMNLYQLIGCQIRFPCGTCSSEYQGISFSGTASGLSVGDDAVVKSSSEFRHNNVNLTATPFTDADGSSYKGYLEAVSSLMDKQASAVPQPTDDEKKDQAKTLARNIAKDLRNKVYDAMDEVMGKVHFDRVLKAEGDDYSLIVYDYRDNGHLTWPKAADSSVIMTGKAKASVSTTHIQPGEFVDIETPMHIMAGAVSQSWLPIHLPDICRASLGLMYYDVARYEERESYSPSYQAKIDAWKETGYHETSVTRTVTGPVSIADGYRWENGEPRVKVKTEIQTWTETETHRTWDPKPNAGPGDVWMERQYTPSHLQLVDDAIAKVSRARSQFGAEQNRLEHAYNINANTSENSQSAESRIRDTDMAEEMVNNTKHNILEQAGQSMLAQANQSTQGVLALLGY